jgi:hypothetical protein
MEGYWCYWHGEKAWLGRGLHVRKVFRRGRAPIRLRSRNRSWWRRWAASSPLFTSPTAAGLSREDAIPGGDGRLSRRSVGRPARSLRRPNVARTDQDVHPAQAERSGAPDEREVFSGCCRQEVDLTRALARQRRALHVVGAVAQPPPAKYRWRYILASGVREGDPLRRPRLRRHSDHAPLMAEFLVPNTNT